MLPLRRVVLAVLLLPCLAGCSGGGDDVARVPAVDDTSDAPTVPPAPTPTTAQTAAPTAAPTAPGALSSAERVGAFDVDEVPEASGLAASRRTPGVLYLLDDATGTTGVVAVRPDGMRIGRIDVAGLDARDTEDLAVGACGPDDDRTCLYVGDIGDNRARRDAVDVWRVVEPDLAAGAPPAPLEADRVLLRYPDGPRDAEALLVDAAGSPVIVSKSADDATVYAADGFVDQTLRAAGDLALPAPTLPLASAVVGDVVTAGDARDGVVLLRTYDAVFRFTAEDPAAPLEGFATWPVEEVPAPAELQGEAVALEADGCGYYTVSEGIGDIWHVACAS